MEIYTKLHKNLIPILYNLPIKKFEKTLDKHPTPWYNVLTKDEREVAKMFAITLYKEIWVTCKTREEAEQRMAIIKTAPIYRVHPAGAFKIVEK